MATTKPIRQVTKTITPAGSNLILLDDGISMGKATLSDGVSAVAGDLIDTAIDDLDLGTASAVDTIDEDDMASDSATKVPTQQSVKAFGSIRRTSGVTRTIKNKILDGMVDIKDFGAVGDGSADDTNAWKAWVDEGKGVALMLSPGRYTFTDANGLNVGSLGEGSINLMGYGPELAGCLFTGSGINIDVSAKPGASVNVSGITFASDGIGTSTALQVTGTSLRTISRSQLLLSRCVFRGTADNKAWQTAIRGVAISDSCLENLAVVGVRDDWEALQKAVWLSTSVDVILRNMRLYWGDTALHLSGDSEGINTSDSHMVGFETGVHVIGANGSAMQHVKGNHMNVNQNGVLLESTDGSTSRHSNVSFNNIIHNVPSNSGIGGDTDYDFTAVSLNSEQSTAIGNVIEGSLTRSDTGVVLNAASDQCVVSGNVIVGCSDTAVDVLTGATDCIVTDNVGPSSAAIRDAGTRTRITGNSKELFVDEVHGGATVANGQTSVTVSHALSRTPSIADIVVVPRSLGNATKWNVANITATTFDIVVDANPGASQATFTWWAKTSKSNL